jgi:hypothetical protein
MHPVQMYVGRMRQPGTQSVIAANLRLKSLFRPRCVSWSEQKRIELHAQPQWQASKVICPNWFPWLVYSMEPQWTGMFKRKLPRRPKGSPLFDDPPADQADPGARNFRPTM